MDNIYSNTIRVKENFIFNLKIETMHFNIIIVWFLYSNILDINDDIVRTHKYTSVVKKLHVNV